MRRRAPSNRRPFRVLALLVVLLIGCGEEGRSTRSAPTPQAAALATTGRPTPGAGTETGSTPDDGTARETGSTPKRGGKSPLRYGVLGDSYSNGQSVSPQAAWPMVMARRLTEEGLPVEVVANPSVTGATTAQMIETGIGPIRAARPDVMTVMLGVNDQVQGRATEQFASDEDRALRDAIAITGSADRVIAIDIPDYSVSPTGARFGSPAQIADQISAFNAVVRTVAAKRKVKLVSIVDISQKLGSRGISSDGLHPSEAQLVAWAERIAPVALRQWRGLRPTSG